MTQIKNAKALQQKATIIDLFSSQVSEILEAKAKFKVGELYSDNFDAYVNNMLDLTNCIANKLEDYTNNFKVANNQQPRQYEVDLTDDDDNKDSDSIDNETNETKTRELNDGGLSRAFQNNPGQLEDIDFDTTGNVAIRYEYDTPAAADDTSEIGEPEFPEVDDEFENEYDETSDGEEYVSDNQERVVSGNADTLNI